MPPARRSHHLPPTPDAELIHLLDSVAEGVTVWCYDCPATADRPNPSGWVVARRAGGSSGERRYGVCPSCLHARYHFRATTALWPRIPSTHTGQ